MEAVAALFTVGTTATAAAATTATAATAATAAGATAATAASMTAWSVLQGAATAASVLASLGGGVMALSESNKQAQLSEVEGEQARLSSEQRANAIQRDLLMKTGAARVAFAGSGVDIGSGSPVAVEDALATDAKYQTGIERENAVLRQLNAQARGDGLRERGLAQFVSGVGRAATTAAGYGIDIRNRG